MKLLLFIALIFSAFAQAQQSRLVLRNVNVVDVQKGELLLQQTVVIKDGRITSLQKDVRIEKGDCVVNGSGKYLIPGLWDMHIHALTDKRYTWVFPLLIANGVTGIREMGHNLKMEDVNQLALDVLNGKMAGPRFGAITASILDGPGTKLNVAVPVTTEEEGRQWVRRFKQQGVGFIKPYNLLSREAYLAIVDECKKQNLPFAGHVPFSMTATEVAELGQRSIEHHTDVLLSCATNEAELRKDLLDSLRLQPAGLLPTLEVRAAATYDPQKAKRLYARFKKNGTWLCPTLVLSSRSAQTPAERESDSNLLYVPATMRTSWRVQAALQLQRVPMAEDRKLRAGMRQQATTDMIKQGVALLAGTDAPNPYIYPGFSLHDELALLVEAGLSPAAVLKMATFDAVRFLGKEKELGLIKKGMLADLVLLNANPLQDIVNTKKIYAVIANGRLFTRSDLDRLLYNLKAQVAEARLNR